MKNVVTFAGICLIFIGLMGSCMALVIPHSHEQLRKERLSAEATVVSIEYNKTTIRNKSPWFVTVVFNDATGKQYQHQENSQHSYSIGDKGEILYVQNDPTQALFLGADGDWANSNSMITSFLLALLGALLLGARFLIKE